MKIVTIVYGCMFLLSTSAFAGSNKQQKGICDSSGKIATAVVGRGVDGDTVHVDMDGRDYSVRMLGMDTPESHFKGKSQGKWADVAASEMQRMLPQGTEVELEFGDTRCDIHGRLLAHIFRKVDKVHTNREMVRKGLAVNYCVAPSFEHCDEFADLTARAISDREGMFSDPKVELPYDFRRRISGAAQRSFVGNIRSKDVHRPGLQDRVPVADRVFFYQQADVRSPYHIVD